MNYSQIGSYRAAIVFCQTLASIFKDKQVLEYKMVSVFISHRSGVRGGLCVSAPDCSFPQVSTGSVCVWGGWSRGPFGAGVPGLAM